MNELIINNRRVDFSENTNIGLTFSANNIGELQNRQGNFSNTFKLPITKINKEIFEWSHLQNSSSSMPYKKLKATYKQNGIEIVSEGVAEISSVDNNFFYVNVYSGNIDLMEAIGDVTVGELYKNDTVFNWDIDRVYNSNVNNYYIYPLIDWRKDIDTFFITDSIDMTQMLPCCVVSQMFNRLSDYTGFNFSGNYLTSSSHLNMILTPNEFSIPSSDAIKTSQPLTTTNSSPYTNISTGSSVSYIYNFPTFRNESLVEDFSLGAFKPTINKVGKLNFSGNYQLYFSGSTGIKAKQSYVNISIIDDLNNVICGPIKSGPHSYGLINLELNIETPEFTFLADRIYKVKIEIEVPQSNKVQTVNFFDFDSLNPTLPKSITLSRFLKFTPSPKISFNTPLNFVNLFTMKVKDVLKDILNMEAIIIQTNNYTKSIQFNKFDDINLNKQISKDWSRKIQSSKSMSFKFGNYAKKNNVKFKTESDNDGAFYLPQDNLEIEKDVVKFGHDATFQYNRYNGFIIPTIDALKDGSNEWNSPTWRLLNLKIQDTDFNVKYTYGTDIYSKNTRIPFCYFKNANTIIDDSYSAIFNIIQAPKVLKIVANLDITDISDLDFSVPIQINRPDLNLSGYFYINKIENYKGNLTSCEIIEI